MLEEQIRTRCSVILELMGRTTDDKWRKELLSEYETLMDSLAKVEQAKKANVEKESVLITCVTSVLEIIGIALGERFGGIIFDRKFLGFLKKH